MWVRSENGKFEIVILWFKRSKYIVGRYTCRANKLILGSSKISLGFPTIYKPYIDFIIICNSKL